MDVFGELSSLFLRAWELIVVDQAVVDSETRDDTKDDAAGCGGQNIDKGCDFGGWWKTCCHRRDGRYRQARGLIWVRDPVWYWRGVRCLWWCRKSNSGKEQRGGNQQYICLIKDTDVTWSNQSRSIRYSWKHHMTPCLMLIESCGSPIFKYSRELLIIRFVQPFSIGCVQTVCVIVSMVSYPKRVNSFDRHGSIIIGYFWKKYWNIGLWRQRIVEVSLHF